VGDTNVATLISANFDNIPLSQSDNMFFYLFRVGLLLCLLQIVGLAVIECIQYVEAFKI